MIKHFPMNRTPKKVIFFNQYLNMGLLSGSQSTKIYIDLLLSAQARCCKLATDKIKLPILQSRHQFTNLCEAYKILNGYCKMKVNNFVIFSTRWMHGHSQKLMKQHSKKKKKTLARSNFFALMVMDRSNTLPNDAVNAPMLTIFKRKLEILLK